MRTGVCSRVTAPSLTLTNVGRRLWQIPGSKRPCILSYSLPFSNHVFLRLTWVIFLDQLDVIFEDGSGCPTSTVAELCFGRVCLGERARYSEEPQSSMISDAMAIEKMGT
jgi:hypothetical protein